MIEQKSIFLDGEGDAYYQRNATKHDQARPEFEVFKNYAKPGQSILEIGCSDGRNGTFFKSLGLDYHGIDPSLKAVHAAQEIHPKSQIVVGTADELAFASEAFDWVFFGFCLYLVDRKLLAKTVYEADRVLKNEGYLAILDFETNSPLQRQYSHRDGVSTFKMNYASLFEAFPHYSLATKTVFSVDPRKEMQFETSPQDRLSLAILYKNLDQGHWNTI